MKPLSPLALILIAVVSAAIVALITFAMIIAGVTPISPTLWLNGLFVFLALLLLYLGFHVKRYRKGQNTWMGPLHAARAAVLAHASTTMSAAVAGTMIGLGGASLGRIESSYIQGLLIGCVTVCLTAALCCVAAAIVERWCVITPEDESDDRESMSLGSRGRRHGEFGRPGELARHEEPTARPLEGTKRAR